MKIVSDLLKISGLFLLGLAFGTLFGVCGLAIIGIIDISNPQEYQQILNLIGLQIHPQGKWIMFYLQACTAIGGFLVSTWIYLAFFEEKKFDFFEYNPPKLSLFLLPVFALVVVVMPFTAWVVAWNNDIKFPEPFHSWAITQETQAQTLTLFLTNFNSIFELMIGILVIGILPAIGEEWLFRGIIQKKLQLHFLPNKYAHHIAIWVSAITFSAIHVQFFGFVPRMLLGAMFGYLYVWTSDLRVAIWGHFLNNTITLLMVYFFKQGITQIDVIKQESPDIWAIIISFVLTSGILYFMYQAKIQDKKE